MRLQGKRRLRKEKLQIVPRVHPAQAEREEKLGQKSEAPSAAAADDGGDDEDDEGVEWSPSMKKDELAAVAESVGIDTEGMLKADIVEALDKLS